MKYMRMAIMLFVLAAIGATRAAAMTDAEVKSMLDKASKFYDAKQYAKAVELYDQLGDYIKSDSDAGELYNIACTYSLVGRKDRAIEVLKLAVAAGWNTFDDRNHMTYDGDLDNIRNEPAFVQIMADLQVRAERATAAAAYWTNPGDKKTFAGREYERIGMATARIDTSARPVGTLKALQGHILTAPLRMDSGVVISSFDPATGKWQVIARTQDAVVRAFRPIDGDLFFCGQFPDEGFRDLERSRNSEHMNLYRLPASGGMVKYRTAPEAVFLFDIEKYNSEFYLSGHTVTEDTWWQAKVWHSTDGCLSWQQSYELPRYNSHSMADTTTYLSRLCSFAGKLYEFGFAWRHATVGGAPEFVPDAFGGKETGIFDGTTWTRADLITDKGLLKATAARDVADKLVLIGSFAPGTGAVSLTDPFVRLRSVIYTYDGTGTAKRAFDNSGFNCADWTTGGDGALYVLGYDGQVIRTADAAKFTTVLTVPKELNPTRLEVFGGYLYLGCMNGEVYRTKL